MRAYQVSVAKDGVQHTIFAGTNAGARAARQDLVDRLKVKKSAVELVEVDVPTAKDGLLVFLNKLVKSL